MIGDGLTVMSTEDDATTPTASTIVSVMVKFPVLLNVKVFPDCFIPCADGYDQMYL